MVDCWVIHPPPLDLVLLFGRRISSPRCILFRLPAHLPPIHRFGVAVRPAHLIAAPHSLSFAGAFAADPPIWCCCSAGASHRRAAFSFVCRRIRHRSTDLVLFCLAGASHRCATFSFVCRRICRQSTNLVLFRLAGAFAANPPIWCCSVWPAHSPPSRHRFGVWPAHSPPIRSLCLPAHLPPTHQFGVAPFGWCIPSPDHHCPFWPSHPLAAPPLSIYHIPGFKNHRGLRTTH